VAVLGGLQQRIDQPVALVGAGVRQELLHLLGGGQRAGDVQGHAADELLVAAQLGRDDPQLFPLLLGEAVHDRAGLELVIGHLHAQGDGGAEDGDVPLVAGHDGGLAAHLQGADQGGAVHHRDLGVVALVLGALGDVLHAAVAVVGVDGELLAVVPRQDAVLGGDHDLRHHRVLGVAERCPGGDPAAEELVLVGAELHALAAGVRHRPGRLEQQQAVLRRGRQQPPPAVLLHQGGVVHFGDEAEQGEGEAVLATGLAVAAPRVAPQLGEHRHHVVGEVDRQVHVAAGGGDRDGDLPVAVGGGHLGGAVADGQDPAGGGDAGDLGVGRLVLDVTGQVLQPPAREGGGEDELVRGVGPLEGDLCGVDGQGLHFRGPGHRHRVGLGGLLVVEVVGTERPARGGEGREGRQDGPVSAYAFHQLPPC